MALRCRAKGTGAKVYHIRRLLHDWDYENCGMILHLRTDMTVGFSQLLFDELVLPEGLAQRPQMLDMVMMSISGQERDQLE